MSLLLVACAVFVVFSIGFVVGRKTKKPPIPELDGRIIIYKLDSSDDTDEYLYLDEATPDTIRGKNTVTFKVDEVVVPQR